MNRLISRLSDTARGPRFRRTAICGVAFLLPVLVLLLTYLVRGLFLRGEGVLLFSTLDSEHLALIRLLRSPATIPSFFATAQIETAVQTAMLAASPINWLIALMPLSKIKAALALASLLRAGLAGLTFSVYLSSKHHSPLVRVAFSLLYALSSYAVVMTYSLTYVDTLILFPLVMLGLERLVHTHRISLYAASLAVSVLTNPYAIFPLLIISVIYTVYLTALSPSTASYKLYTASYLICGFVIALFASAATFFPVYSIMRADVSLYSFTATLDILDFLAKMLPGTYDGAADAALPYLYVGILPLLLIPTYFCSARIPRRERIATGVLWFFLYLNFSINIVNAAWSLFIPAIPAYASAFVLVFLFLTAAARAFSLLEGRDERILLISSGVITVLLSLIQKLDLSYTVSSGDSTQEVPYTSDVTLLWLSLLFVVLHVALLILFTRRGDANTTPKARRMLAAALLISVSIEMLAASSELVKLIDKDEKYASEGELKVYERAAQAALSLSLDAPLYRLETTDKRTPSDSLFYRYPSLSGFDSDTLAGLGISLGEDGVLSDAAAPLMLSLFGVRYLVQRETIRTVGEDDLVLKYPAAPIPDSLVPWYSPASGETDAEKGDAPLVYENASALPLLFAASQDVLRAAFSLTATPFETANSLFAALTGEEKFTPYQPVGFEESAHVSGSVRVDGYTVYERNVIEYTLQAPASGSLYFSLFTLYPREASITANGTSTVLFEDAEDTTLGTVYLGEYAAGETVQVSLTFHSSSDRYFYIPEGSPLFWQADTASVTERLTELSASALSSPSLRGDALTGKIHADAGELLFTTLPYDGGWTVKVDGKPCKPESVMGCFLAIPLGGAGEHTVSISRTPPRDVFPIVLSFIGIALLSATVVLESVHSEKRRHSPLSCEREVQEK